MKKIFNNKKNLTIGIICFLVVVIFAGITIKVYADNKLKEELNKYNSEITEIYEKFEKEESREVKLETLKGLVSEYEEYLKLDKTYDSIKEEYKSKISNMNNFFLNEYEKEIKENTLEEGSKEESSNSKTNLEKLLEKINSEKEIVNDLKMKEFEDKINELIKSYDEKLLKIEEEEKKAEEERKEKEKLNNQQNSGSSNNSGYTPPSNNTTAPNNPTPPASGGGYERPWNAGFDWAEGTNGEIVWINPETGDFYDKNGNWLYNGHNPLS